jgi:hypothetical protein
MAKIIFSIEELIKILISNDLLPKNIIRVKVKDESVHFYIKTQSFILPFIPASLRFLSLDNNNVTFELTVVSDKVNKAIGRFDQFLDFEMPAYMRLEYPNIVVDIDKLLQEKNIRGLQLKNVFFENDEFVVETDSV